MTDTAKVSHLKNPLSIERAWHHFDAEGKILGRMCTEIATILRGKHKVAFRRNTDLGDMVVVTNAAKVVVTGAKETDKIYAHHTGYPGGLRETSLSKMREQKPEQIIIAAVTGMLPKTKQRDIWLTRLKVYAGNENPHAANIGKK